MARSLNKVQLIGNLTRDPELRYTPQGTAVSSFSVATNRQWTTESGEKKEDAEFHRVVAWNKLAEICSQMLRKGSRVFVEGRLQTRDWEGQDGQKRTTTEVVISDMISLEGRRESGDYESPPEDLGQGAVAPAPVGADTSSVGSDSGKTENKPEEKVGKSGKETPDTQEEAGEDIPF